jgi:NhaA family Na+:H+ antiporter
MPLPHAEEPVTARQATPARSLPLGIQRFIRTEASGGLVLLAAAVVAVAWANSPWSHGYEALWHSRVVVALGPFRLDEDLRHFVNDGLMALFFFVVGLEVKRELVRGELADRRVAALPVCAALAGMAVPALVYLAVTAGSPASPGWGIPMATDIAFALAVLAVLGDRAPAELKLLLLTLAIVDDIGAIVVIAVFYSAGIDAVAVALATIGVAATVALVRARVDWPPLYIVLGLLTWYATYRSGVHATLAGVALGLAAPATPLAPAHTATRWAQDLSDAPTAAEMRQMAVIARESVSAVEHLEARLNPLTSFVVLPVFGLANAGVALRSEVLAARGAKAAAVGVACGLVLGKLVGILAGAWLAVRLGWARLPPALRWLHMAGLAALGGVGFTVSLFITAIAFTDPALAAAAKAAVLGASVIAGALGAALLLAARRTIGPAPPNPGRRS